jgi:hypothetical protein
MQDVACKESSGIIDTYVTALRAAEQAQIDAHPAELQAWSDWCDAGDRLAAAVLARQ